MDKVIIGIHGLANKPEQSKLEEWWINSIKEGLANIDVESQFDFKMVYWAKYLYKYPLHDDKDYSFDDLFNTEPYQAAEEGEIKEYYDGFFDEVRARGRNIVGNSMDFLKDYTGISSLANWALGKYLKDLAFYYSDTQQLKDKEGDTALARIVLQNILKKELEACAGKKIMVIAHSMGSIIAYDVLQKIHADKPDFSISDFITIGSPLGLPHVISMIKCISGNIKVVTPEAVKGRWMNFADNKDVVAADFRLADDYKPNLNNVKVVDDLVYNSYHIKDNYNHHKSYGYLRTPEVSRRIADFLNQ